MDLNAVKMFVHVVQAGSLSAGSERLRLPLPTVSRRIRELERQLNVQLLERSVHGARLTVAGSRLYDLANRGIETLREAEESLVSDQSQLNGRLRLSLPPTFEPWWQLLALFQQRYPNIQLQVFCTERRVNLIEDGIDVALRVGAIVHETMIAKRIFSYRHILVAGRALVERLGLPESVEALNRFPCAAWSANTTEGARWILGNEVITPQFRLTVNDYAVLRNGVIAGEFVTELPPFLAVPAIVRGELVALMTERPLPELAVHLLYPAHRHQSTIVRTYLDFCRQQVPSVLASYR